MQSVESLESRRLFAVAGGTPVTSFGTNGLTTVTFRDDAGNSASPVALLADSGGRSYVVAATPGTIQVRRVTADGRVDATYANVRGLIGLPVGQKVTSGGVNGVVDAAIDSADRLYVLAGNVVNRFTVSGKFDRTYGVNGATTLGRFTEARGLTVGAGDKLYAVGTLPYAADSAGKASTQAAVTRLRTSGKLDSTFAVNGVYAFPLPGGPKTLSRTSAGTFIRTDRSGHVYAISTASSRYTNANGTFTNTGGQVVRFNDVGGTIDFTYHTNGLASHFAVSGDITFGTSRPQALLGDGTALFADSSISDSPGDEGRSSNPVISPRGYPVDDYAGAAVYGDRSVLLSDGSEVVASGTAVARNTARQKSDNTFALAAGTGRFANAFITADPDRTLLAVSGGSKPLTVNVRRLFNNARPVADLVSKPLTKAGPLTFSVRYQSIAGFARDAADGTEVDVISPKPFTLPASVIGREVAGQTFVVRYQASGNFPLTSANNGAYAVTLLAKTLKDMAGESAGGRFLGNVIVAIKDA